MFCTQKRHMHCVRSQHKHVKKLTFVREYFVKTARSVYF